MCINAVIQYGILQPLKYSICILPTYLRFRLFPVRSPLLRESLLISFPLVTKMFQFTRFLFISYVFRYKCIGITLYRFPHSEISGSKLISSFPKLIAANHVLHQLVCQEILHVPLIS